MKKKSSSTLSKVFRDRSVWVSGHTGFKGAWLCEWLLTLGAKVHGYSLEPPTHPSLFDQLGLAGRIQSHGIADIRDADGVAASLRGCRPDFVFHLAAQSLVRESYRSPLATFGTNTLGTVHVLEGLREVQYPCAAILVTTDKVYENREWVHAYRETDRLGGHDPYSASKAAAELAVASYRRSFFGSASPVRIASVRAGNVIGGGDWAEDRIIPDCVRAWQDGRQVSVRAPGSIRPWQHVLEPLYGYLLLAAELAHAAKAGDGNRLGELESGFNFGPDRGSARTVRELVEGLAGSLGFEWSADEGAASLHEAQRLSLDAEKAFRLLGWTPRWSFEAALEMTADWFRKVAQGGSAVELTRGQIRSHCEA